MLPLLRRNMVPRTAPLGTLMFRTRAGKEGAGVGKYPQCSNNANTKASNRGVLKGSHRNKTFSKSSVRGSNSWDTSKLCRNTRNSGGVGDPQGSIMAGTTKDSKRGGKFGIRDSNSWDTSKLCRKVGNNGGVGDFQGSIMAGTTKAGKRSCLKGFQPSKGGRRIVDRTAKDFQLPVGDHAAFMAIFTRLTTLGLGRSPITPIGEDNLTSLAYKLFLQFMKERLELAQEDRLHNDKNYMLWQKTMSWLLHTPPEWHAFIYVRFRDSGLTLLPISDTDIFQHDVPFDFFTCWTLPPQGELMLHVNGAVFEDVIFCTAFVIRDHTANPVHHSTRIADCPCDILAKSPSHKCDTRFVELKALIEGLEYCKRNKLHNIHAYCGQKWVVDMLNEQRKNEENIFVKELADVKKLMTKVKCVLKFIHRDINQLANDLASNWGGKKYKRIRGVFNSELDPSILKADREGRCYFKVPDNWSMKKKEVIEMYQNGEIHIR